MKDNLYVWADEQINTSPKLDVGFTQLLSPDPYVLPSQLYEDYFRKYEGIKEFQDISIKIFRLALQEEVNPTILHWLINETPTSLGLEYHKSLEERHFTAPLFFRTDEVRPGRIIEVQCPGSLWGDLQLSYEYLVEAGLLQNGDSPAKKFSNQLKSVIPTEPIVHYLIDNASLPSSAVFFISKTRPDIKYWGIDKGVSPGNCNFIRSHSFYSVCADNEFRDRWQRVGNDVIYDYPPHVLFDQKATLVLPFWSLTKHYFSDECRDQIVFSTPLLPKGIELKDGSCESIETFSKRSRSKRSFFLKYAGSDVSLNWGSKAVYRLSNCGSNKCLELLKQCLAEYQKGKIWLLQEEEKCDEKITYIDRNLNKKNEKARAKFSAFYGPQGFLGLLAMHRQHFKVHGQHDTIISYVVSSDR